MTQHLQEVITEDLLQYKILLSVSEPLSSQGLTWQSLITPLGVLLDEELHELGIYWTPTYLSYWIDGVHNPFQSRTYDWTIPAKSHTLRGRFRRRVEYSLPSCKIFQTVLPDTWYLQILLTKMASQQPLLMDVDANSQEDELSTTSSSHALRRSASLRSFRYTSRQRAASRQKPFAQAPSSQPTPTPQDDLWKKADRILRFLGYFSRDLQRPKMLNRWLLEQCWTLVNDSRQN